MQKMLFLLYGPDTFRLREKLKQLKEKFKREVDPSGINLICVNSEKPTLDEIKKAITVSSFLAKKRMVIIENIISGKETNLKKNLLEIIKNKNLLKDTIVILVEEQPQKNDSKKKDKKNPLSEIFKLCDYKQEFPLLSEGELAAWIKNRIKKNNGSITNQATELLASYTGPDLWALNNEINKLTAYKNDQEITEEDVINMVKSKIDDNIFQLTDAISQKDSKRSLKLINDFLQNGYAESYILNMIIFQFRNLLAVKSLQDNNSTIAQIRKELKLHPFVLQKNMVQAKRFSLTEIKKIYNQLLDIDGKIKTSQAKPLVLFDLFLVNLTK